MESEFYMHHFLLLIYLVFAVYTIANSKGRFVFYLLAGSFFCLALESNGFFISEFKTASNFHQQLLLFAGSFAGMIAEFLLLLAVGFYTGLFKKQKFAVITFTFYALFGLFVLYSSDLSVYHQFTTGMGWVNTGLNYYLILSLKGLEALFLALTTIFILISRKALLKKMKSQNVGILFAASFLSVLLTTGAFIFSLNPGQYDLAWMSAISMFFLSSAIIYSIVYAQSPLPETPFSTERILKKMPAGLILTDISMRISYVNSALLEITGYSESEFKNRSLIDIISSLAFDEYDDNLFSDNEKVNITRRDGTKKVVSWKTEKIYDKDNQVVGTMSVINDLDLLAKTEEELRMLNNSIEEEVARRTKQLEQAHAQNRKNEAMYRYLFENHASKMLIVDPDMCRIVNANKAAIKFYGYKSSQMDGMELSKISTLTDIDVHRFCQQVKDFRRNQSLMEHQLADGSRRIVEIDSTPIFNEGKCFIYSIIRDVTDAKSSELNLRKLSQAVEQSPVIVIITNTTGAIEYVNKRFSEITGYQRHEIIGKKPNVLKSGDKSEADYKELWETISQGKKWSGGFRNKKKNGELYYESALISPVRDAMGKITHYVSVKEDITEQKLIHERYQQVQDKLEELSGQIHNAREEERMTISRELHDNLGQNLTALKMELFSLKKNMLAGSKSEEGLVNMNNNIIGYVDVIIDTVRKISRQLRPDNVNYFGLVGAVKKLVYELDEQSEMKVSFHSHVAGVNFQESKAVSIYRIIQEALNNAFRHSQAQNVNVSIESYEEQVVFRVSDDGSGFRKKEHSVTEHLGIQGMNERAELLGGKLSVNTKRNKGTTIELILSQETIKV